MILKAKISFTTLQKLIKRTKYFDKGVTKLFKTLAHLQLGYKARKAASYIALKFKYIFQVESESRVPTGSEKHGGRLRRRAGAGARVTGALVK